MHIINELTNLVRTHWGDSVRLIVSYGIHGSLLIATHVTIAVSD